jgi:hypothetical protein
MISIRWEEDSIETIELQTPSHKSLYVTPSMTFYDLL